MIFKNIKAAWNCLMGGSTIYKINLETTTALTGPDDPNLDSCQFTVASNNTGIFFSSCTIECLKQRKVKSVKIIKEG